MRVTFVISPPLPPPPPPPPPPPQSSFLQLSRDKRTLEDKLQDTQQALEGEENKSKQEHRQRLKLESNIQDLDEKLDRESKVPITQCVCVGGDCVF